MDIAMGTNFMAKLVNQLSFGTPAFLNCFEYCDSDLRILNENHPATLYKFL